MSGLLLCSFPDPSPLPKSFQAPQYYRQTHKMPTLGKLSGKHLKLFPALSLMLLSRPQIRSHLVTEPQKGWGWKAPLEIICPTPLLKAESSRDIMLFLPIPMQKRADAETLRERDKDCVTRLDTHVPQEFLQHSKKRAHAYFLTIHDLQNTAYKFHNLAC